MQDFRVAPDVHWCRTDDGLVLLDLKTEQYLGIGGAQLRLLEQVVPTWRAEEQGLSDDIAEAANLASSLVKHGLLTPSDAGDPRPKSTNVPAPESAIPYADALEAYGWRAAILIRLALAYQRASHAVRRRPLLRTVQQLRKQKLRSNGARENRLLWTYSTWYMHLRPLVFTAKERCVVDSLTMILFLAGLRLYPTWVFGAKTLPFGAHCWVQHEGLVLNDTLERVRAYTPILAV